ncbi:MAG: prepilin peptidase [Tindallia sp. MSAO_Bac2]|nr:MAG: prepilin peptidase [Tindallia sp. MSAO_Bac2]
MTILDGALLITIAICFYTDVKEQKIYNKVLLPAFVIGLLGNVITGGFSGFGSSALGLLLGMGLLILPFVAGGMGAGDVKLMGIIGLYKGPAFVFQTFLITAIIGGIIALIILAKRKKLGYTFRNFGAALTSLFLLIPKGTVLEGLNQTAVASFPYGIAISLGTILAYLVG